MGNRAIIYSVLIITITIGAVSITQVAMGFTQEQALDILIYTESIFDGTLLDDSINNFISHYDLPYEFGV